MSLIEVSYVFKDYKVAVTGPGWGMYCDGGRGKGHI